MTQILHFMKCFLISLSVQRSDNFRHWCCVPGIFTLIAIFIPASIFSQTSFYGMTSGYGTYGNGSIFNINPDGSGYDVKYEFPADHPEIHPGRVVRTPDGKLYGAAEGGFPQMGVFYEFNPATGIFRKIHEFSGADGAYPNNSAPVLADNGKIYGTTAIGGQYNAGTIYEYDPQSDLFKMVFEFDGMNGNRPGGMVKTAEGKLYGYTVGGGCNSAGAFFEFDADTGICTKRYDFEGMKNGAVENGELTPGPNGKLYGTNIWCGASYEGILYEFDPVDSTFVTKFDFTYPGGSAPWSTMVLASDGKLYGATYGGGPENKGVLFSYDLATDAYSSLHNFQEEAHPYALIEYSNGVFYGLTAGGADHPNGTLFKYIPSSGVFSTELSFNLQSGAPSRNSLVKTPDGSLLIAAYSGGRYGGGTFLKYELGSGATHVLLDLGSPNGARPRGSLMQADNGKLYGVTEYGGAFNDGTLFEFDPGSGAYTRVHDFDGLNGANPVGRLLQASNGKLYGMTSQGGNSGPGFGTVFEYNPSSGEFINVLSFNGFTGAYPGGSLMQASSGKLYGLTESRVDNVAPTGGVLFELDPDTYRFQHLYYFDYEHGYQPVGGLVEANNGKFYGLTRFGGTYSGGVIFEFDPETGNYAAKRELNDASFDCYTEPYGNLVLAKNGKLYGLASSSCSSDRYGALFEYDPASSSLSAKVSFDGANGRSPHGSLIAASNGKLYGMTLAGGQQEKGVIFEFDPDTGDYRKIRDLSDADGSYPYGDLLEVFTPGSPNPSNAGLYVFPNPANGPVTLRLPGFGGHEVSIRAYNGLGQLVRDSFNGILGSETYRIDLSGLPAGVYFIAAKSGKTVETRAVVLRGRKS